jgi:alkylation response protein AidB-like acyl-CoA dehydrogenase
MGNNDINFFNQPGPELGNQFLHDPILRSYLRRILPADLYAEARPSLEKMGALAGGELYARQLADQALEPSLVQWDAWGERVDRVAVTPLWQRAEELAVEYGLVATAYEREYGRFSRTIQFALAYLFHPSTDFYTCPLAMTDGAAKTLLLSGNEALIARVVPRLTSRDPAQFWTSGQWMTESSGGSDVGLSQTTAVRGGDGQWRLYGRKWFTSAVTAPIALALARPEGNPPGGRGLALFYVELRDENGQLNNLRVNRLKDKLGTRKLPTAELSLEGTTAVPVHGLDHGVRSIIPMLHLTRTWNSVTAVSTMRRGLALAGDYARKRVAFGAPLSEQPLHADTLVGMEAETAAAFQLTFFLVNLLGREEAGELAPEEDALLRLLTSVAKLTTGRQAVIAASEALEAFGGAGYVEDTGLPLLLRDSQVFPIWEGTTNVLALDVLRAIMGDPTGLQVLQDRAALVAERVSDERLEGPVKTAVDALNAAVSWLERSAGKRELLEAGARRFALTQGRALALALLVEQADWSLSVEDDDRALRAARRFARMGASRIFEEDE